MKNQLPSRPGLGTRLPLFAAITVSCCLAAVGRPLPWWDTSPLIVQTGDVGTAKAYQAAAALCGAADDPAWGLYAQRLRMLDGDKRIAQLHAAGIKAMSWLETYGQVMCYVAQMKRSQDGGWVTYDRAPDLTRIFRNAWGWQRFDGTGEIRWVGAENYFDNDDFARPFTRTNPRYGAPPMTYPDGTVATGFNGDPTNPRNSRVYDAGCSKNVLGGLAVDYSYNNRVNRKDGNGAPHGPLRGLVKTAAGYAGIISIGKDSACPIWTHYVHASALDALDAGIDGFWCDNYSPWDSFGNAPIQKAFGDWSVALFRRYLKRHFSRHKLVAMAVPDVDHFDVRTYLRRRCTAFGGKAENLHDPHWRDSRWLNDPIWRAYEIYKRQTGTKALTRFYRAIKAAAREAGKPAPLICGNDIPIFSLGWPRGQLDMVSTELSWGWGLTTGARGLMPPPDGSYVPVYKLARVHAKSRFVNVWMYVPTAEWGKPNIAKALFYQAMANNAFPMPHSGNPRTAGDDAGNEACFAFARNALREIGERVPVDEIGVYYSSSSQLAHMCPGGFVDFNDQPHIFAYWGWGTALTWLHQQYRVVPEWRLDAAGLRGLKVLIIPNAEVFDRSDVPVLKKWVENGGKLIVTGATGVRGNETHNFDRNPGDLSLAPLTGVRSVDTAPAALVHAIGSGRVLYLRNTIGRTFYQADAHRKSLLATFRKVLGNVGWKDSDAVVNEASTVSFTVGLTVYEAPSGKRLFVDANNTDIDVASDTVRSSPECTFTVRLPPSLAGRPLQANVLSPDDKSVVKLTPIGVGRARIALGGIRFYAAIVISPK